MKKVEKFKITSEAKKYLKQVKALSRIRDMIAIKKKNVNQQSMLLDGALNDADQAIMKALQVPGERLMFDISDQEEDHG